MTLLAFIVLLGWIPFVIMLFSIMPARVASAIAVVGAWLVVPPYNLGISGLPDYSKTTAATVGMLLGTLLFDPGRIVNFRPRWFDLPLPLFCLSACCTSLLNGLGLYDGLSDALNQSLAWALPYLFGRLYFSDPQGLRLFAIAMVIGGLAYVAPCLLESRISPQLLLKVYGRGGWTTLRFGGYRPQVFFLTGLECGLWMTAAALSGWWLWFCGALKKVGQIPFGLVLVLVLIGTAILCRCTGALILLFAGMTVLGLSTRFKTRWLLVGLLLAGPLYVAVRTTNVWTGRSVVDLFESTLGHDRAGSLNYRLMCEDELVIKALRQPFFGWGAFRRSAAYWKDSGQPVVTDGLWIIYLGVKGFVGLTLFYLGLILPAIRFVWQFPPGRWREPGLAAGSLAAVLLGLYVIDCLLNGFPNMVYVVLAGGLAGLTPAQLRATEAVTGNSELAEYNRSLGRALKAEGRFKEAEAVWSHALDSLDILLAADPDNLDLRREWCNCANDLAWLKLHYPELAQGDPSLAIALARRAVEECPEAAVYWNTLGTAHFRAGDDTLAITALDRSTALGGSTAFNDIFLAMAHARLGNREHAEHLIVQAVSWMERHNPGHPELRRFCDEARSILVTCSH